jgi:hypothetical protein
MKFTVYYYLEGREPTSVEQSSVPRIGDELVSRGDFYIVTEVTWVVGEPRANIYAKYVNTIEERAGMPKPNRAIE